MFGVGVDLPPPRAWPAAAPARSPSAHAAPEDDAFELAAEYGAEAAARVSAILRELERAGFPKVRDASWRAFDRVLSALAWLLQRLSPREDALERRVQWDALHQPHESMRARLGFAQEVARRIEALPFGGCPVPIQPHQLLLQDFGDIGAVHRVVSWLVEQAREPAHLAAIQQARAYLDVVDADWRAAREQAPYKPLGRDVAYLQRAFGPRRRWQYVAGGGSAEEGEDALIQRCLFEYGERVAAVTELEDEDEGGGDEAEGDTAQTDKFDLMAQIASQVAARAAAAAAGEAAPKKRPTSAGTRRMGNLRVVDADFDKQYQKVRKQAMKEQQELLAKQRERETQLLQQVVSVPEDPADNSADSDQQRGQQDKLLLEQMKADMQTHEALVHDLIQEKQAIDAEMGSARSQADTLDEVMASMQLELQHTSAAIEQDPSAQPYVPRLRELMAQHESLKVQKDTFRTQCRVELDQLHQTILYLKQKATQESTAQDEDVGRLRQVEVKHAKMQARYMELKRAVASQTREVLLKMKQIDEIPTRIELIQYEKRFVELYDEVALTLDETRKYYCVYNTLKTTHEYLEKEISLINSIYDNFDVAMSTKTATDAFFSQVDAIVKNIRGVLAKQEAQRKAHQLEMETLNSKYQVLLERERTYVSAVRDFQKECEKNDRLVARIQAAAAATEPLLPSSGTQDSP